VTGPEHYRAAEERLSILDAAENPADWERVLADGSLAVAMQAAQVHATLALAAATALNPGNDLDGPLDPHDPVQSWWEVAS
jgi:hypothetical protein